MAGKVDLVGVLSEVLMLTQPLSAEHRAWISRVAEAKAAAVELIEAADAMAGVQVNRQTQRNDAGSAKKARLRAALANVR